MDQLIQQVIERARSMWRWRWLGLAVAWLICVGGGVGLALLSDRFEASGRVYVDTKTVLRPLMHDLTVELDLDQTVGLLARTLITRPNVELLMTRSGLETQGMNSVERGRIAERLMRDIKINALGRDNVFTFSYRDTDPERARLIVQNLVSLFLESDTGAKKRDAEAARSFIDEQIKSYESRLRDAEDRLKDFKLRNLGATDTSSGKDYFQRMSGLNDEMNKLMVELKAAEQSRDALKRELGGETVSLLPEVVPNAPGAITTEFDARLDAQRRQLDELLRRYTELHPDVVSTKRLVARLEEEREKAIEFKRKAAAAKPAPASPGTNAVQQQIKLALAEAEANVASLRSRAADMQSKLGQLRASASRVPQIEAEYAQLNRDYEVIKSTYQTMVARREKASLSEDVDATHSTQFRVIDPPRTAPQPVFPNRTALATVSLVFALFAGAAAAFIASQIFPTFVNANTLRLATQRQVLGSVSLLSTAAAGGRARRSLFGFGTGFGSLLVVGAGWIAWVSMQTRV